MAERFILLVCILLLSVPVLGQRVYHKIEPAKGDENFKFDINEVPVSRNILEIGGSFTGRATRDLNFAPNIVFSPDGEKAFVSAPGSDRILVFQPRTGQILDSLQVPANPTELVLSPDKSQIAVVSMRAKENLPKPGQSLEFAGVGALSLIDVETLQVRTAELTDVVFSVGNNPVFSGDGSTVFVASSRTDQLLRIDVETLQEITPRMDLPEGTRPSSITMAPDYSFMTLVLVGSSNLDRVLFPDSIRVIDPNTFTELYTIVPDTGPGREESLIHDFTVANRIAISPDGKYGMLADQQASSLSGAPELTSDRAWLIDFEQRKVIKVYSVGGIAGGTYWVPDGRFVVIAALEVTFIDPSADTSSRFQPLRSDYRPYSKPVFSHNGRFMYLASPSQDSILVFRLGTGEITHPVTVGGEVERGEDTVISSAPMTLAMIPEDSSTLLSLNYNANTIELLRPTERQFISRMLSSSEFFTGVAITNLSDSEAEVIVSGYSNGGVLFVDDEETEDVVEFVNPITLTIPPGAQVA
ncbi:MAG TPA: YncE family protein, partial [Acidobacteriota bacterium]|nr:YncE family protein [Acidobacteriota bacterium]